MFNENFSKREACRDFPIEHKMSTSLWGQHRPLWWFCVGLWEKTELWVLTDLNSNPNSIIDALGDGGLVSYPF